MITYKLFRMKNGQLYPLYVDANTAMAIGEPLQAKVGDKADDTHVKSETGFAQSQTWLSLHSGSVH